MLRLVDAHRAPLMAAWRRYHGLATIEVEAHGLGIHFPRLDADLYVPALLEGVLGSKRWMAARLGAAGGSVRGGAKAAASRDNGRRGGRPRKATAG